MKESEEKTKCKIIFSHQFCFRSLLFFSLLMMFLLLLLLSSEQWLEGSIKRREKKPSFSIILIARNFLLQNKLAVIILKYRSEDFFLSLSLSSLLSLKAPAAVIVLIISSSQDDLLKWKCWRRKIDKVKARECFGMSRAFALSLQRRVTCHAGSFPSDNGF